MESGDQKPEERCNDKYQALLDTFEYIIDQQIQVMGQDLFEKNYGDASEN